jgi:hypothetical protein
MLRMRLSATAVETTVLAIERCPMRACSVLVSIPRAASQPRAQILLDHREDVACFAINASIFDKCENATQRLRTRLPLQIDNLPAAHSRCFMRRLLFPL